MRVEGLNFNAENAPTIEEIEQFFNNLSKLYGEEKDNCAYILDPQKTLNMMECVKKIREMLLGQNVHISVDVFGSASGMGSVRITSTDIVVFKNPAVFSEICRTNKGLDISALNNGNVEIVVSFDTAERLRKG